MIPCACAVELMQGYREMYGKADDLAKKGSFSPFTVPDPRLELFYEYVRETVWK